MKKLGLVGGMGPESTIPYYHDIVYGVQETLGKSLFPELSIESVNVFEVLRLCGEKQYDELTEYLIGAINNLAKSGADFAVLSANTPHIVFDKLKERSPIPLISIVETTCEEAKYRGLKKIGLLGTIFTMKGEFFKSPFIKNGIQVTIPTESEMELINDKISTELELGIVKEETLLSFQKVISRMKNLPNETIDETKSFVEYAVSEWYKDEPNDREYVIVYNDKIIGGINLEYNENKNSCEIGWTIHKEYRNRGFATEAANALIKYAFHVLSIEKVTSHCDSKNIASERVMKKIGMRLVYDGGARYYPKTGISSGEILYDITKTDYERLKESKSV